MGETTVTALDNLTNGISVLLDMASSLIDTALANPVLAICFGAGFIGILAGIIGALKHM